MDEVAEDPEGGSGDSEGVDGAQTHSRESIEAFGSPAEVIHESGGKKDTEYIGNK